MLLSVDRPAPDTTRMRWLRCTSSIKRCSCSSRWCSGTVSVLGTNENDRRVTIQEHDVVDTRSSVGSILTRRYSSHTEPHSHTHRQARERERERERERARTVNEERKICTCTFVPSRYHDIPITATTLRRLFFGLSSSFAAPVASLPPRARTRTHLSRPAAGGGGSVWHRLASRWVLAELPLLPHYRRLNRLA